jgi:hypothetical protein
VEVSKPAEHMFLLMFLIGADLNLLSDIVQLETAANYEGKNDKPFDLRKSYAFIKAEVPADLKTMFPFPEMSVGSPFDMNRVIYRGY